MRSCASNGVRTSGKRVFATAGAMMLMCCAQLVQIERGPAAAMRGSVG